MSAYTPFTTGYHLPRKATCVALEALRGPRRVIAIEGAPLIGKSHVVRAIALSAETAEDMAVLFVEASGTAAIGIADEVARLLGEAIGWRISAEEARHWLRQLAKSDGPTLVIAIDALGLEHDAIRRELETLSAQKMGTRLKFVIEADTSVIDRLWFGESRLKEAVIYGAGTAPKSIGTHLRRCCYNICRCCRRVCGAFPDKCSTRSMDWRSQNCRKSGWDFFPS